ncbi:MAG: DUF11 domain-containing protein [Gemmataceae bacterium]|nr:DUF11 domain-containing protein [Gemmataceae bacterium]
MHMLAALLVLAQPPVLPARGFAPLLFVRFEGAGKATFYQGRASASFKCPVPVGMRPGYRYRVRLGDFPGRPGLVLFPSLEAHGCLLLPPRLLASSFPIPVRLSDDDLDRIEGGAMITKAFYLEHPDKAAPQATKPGEVLEADLEAKDDMLREARARGRVMVVLRVGPRAPTVDEMPAFSVPGTLLYPDQVSVGPAACPPTLLMDTPPFVDPRTGPRVAEEECLHDGGDRGERAGLDAGGKLYGVGPEDTVAEWTDSRGRKHVVPSNRVCLCVPRFLALRQVVGLAVEEAALGPAGLREVRRDILLEGKQRPGHTVRNERLTGFTTRQRPREDKAVTGLGVFRAVQVLEAQSVTLGLAERIHWTTPLAVTKDERLVLMRQLELVRQFSTITKLAGTEQVTGTGVVARVVGGPQTIEAMLTVRDLTVCCGEPEQILLDKPLVLVKCADRTSAQVGDEVEFTLKFTNVGQKPLTDIAVTDSLAGRLEYVANSSRSDRPSVFTMQDNEAGSSLLRWEITGTLQPGESGRVKFKARVR